MSILSVIIGILLGALVSGFVIWILQWVALAGWLQANLGLAPLFMGLGYYYKNSGLIDVAVWCQSAPGVVTISIVGAVTDGR